MFRRKPRPPAEIVPLDDAVRGVAACPCARHQDSFVASLAAADQLILQVVESTAGLAAGGGVHTVTKGEEVKVATAINEEGRTFLQSFSDLYAAQSRHPSAWFISVPARTAFRIAVSSGNEGLLVTASGSGATWAAVTAEGVARLMTAD